MDPGPVSEPVITEAVVPSLHVDYNRNHHQQQHATSGSASNSRTCRPCGRSASKPTDVFWTVQTISHDCSIGEEATETVVRPIEV